MAVYCSDLAKTRTFYKDFLGFGEPFLLKDADGRERIVFIKVNERQYVELFAEATRGQGQLNHICISTDNADAMRDFLASKAIAVPQKVGKGRTGNKNFTVKDPDGHQVEIVEYQPDSWTAREAGKFLPETRISDRILHVGVTAGSLDASLRFYHDILGFNETWRGSSSGRILSWVNLRVPEGEDYLELMLYSKLPAPEERGGQNHISLMVPDIEKAVAVLKSRAQAAGYTREINIHTGVNRRRLSNLFDPDGTRIELMEPNTIDGKPTPSSTAPAPVAAR
jgi:lactoylglutathione lyase